MTETNLINSEFIDSLQNELISEFGFNNLTALSIIMRALAENYHIGGEDSVKQKAHDLAEFVSIILEQNSEYNC